MFRSSAKPLAIVLAADVNGLGAVRSLYEVGVPTAVVVTNRRDISLYSRLPTLKLFVADGKNLHRHLLRTLDSIPACRSVLIPTSDVFVAFMLAHRDYLKARFAFVLPETSVTQTLLDKRTETECMERLRIAIPRTARDLHQNADAWWEALSFPVLIKPRLPSHGRFLNGEKNRRLERPEDAREFSREKTDVLEYFIAQELIPGDDCHEWVCDCVFSRSSDLICAFTFQKQRLSPAHRGTSSFAISRVNPDVLALVKRIGKAIGYVGPADFDLKMDSRDGIYKYIELNPRVGGCNYFGTRCGVNTVASTYLLALDIKSRGCNVTQRDGVAFLCFFEDLYARLKDGERLSEIVWWYLGAPLRVKVSGYWLWYDPFPGIVAAFRNATYVVSFAMRKIRSLWRRPTTG